MHGLWHGSWATRIRIGSGLVLLLYALFHFINIGLGLIGPEAMDAFQDLRQGISRSLIGTVLLYGALVAHGGLAVWRLARRRTLRMPVGEALQTILGLVIPLLLIKHIVFTRIAHGFYDVNDQFDFIIWLIFGTLDGWVQVLLMFVVWTHGCIGLHFWLSGRPWWRRNLPLWTGIATLVPGFGLVGYIVEGRRVKAALSDPELRQSTFETWNFPEQRVFAELLTVYDWFWWGIGAALVAAAVFYLGRKLLIRSRSVRITYVDGPDVNGARGATLLEMSRANGVPHTALCGGRGRCTTCRVIVESGADLLHPASPAEVRSLRAVNAPPNARLACQIRPTDPLTVFRVFQSDGKRGRAHASQGQEKKLAVLFLDIRGFTSRTTGQLPYDVVFLLNRFFDAIVPSVTRAGGTVDKYLGDGFLALFETQDAASSARAGLRAVQEIGEQLEAFNARLQAEGAQPVAIGLGLHLGEVVLGEIGASGNAPRTLIGDTVNTASRLEAKTKELSVQLLVSESVLTAAGYTPPDRDLKPLELRGLNAPLRAMAVEFSADLKAKLEQMETGTPPARAKIA